MPGREADLADRGAQNVARGGDGAGNHPVGNAGGDHFSGTIESVGALVDQHRIADTHCVEAFRGREDARVAAFREGDAALRSRCTCPEPGDEAVKTFVLHWLFAAFH